MAGDTTCLGHSKESARISSDVRYFPRINSEFAVRQNRGLGRLLGLTTNEIRGVDGRYRLNQSTEVSLDFGADLFRRNDEGLTFAVATGLRSKF